MPINRIIILQSLTENQVFQEGATKRQQEKDEKDNNDPSVSTEDEEDGGRTLVSCVEIAAKSEHTKLHQKSTLSLAALMGFYSSFFSWKKNREIIPIEIIFTDKKNKLIFTGKKNKLIFTDNGNISPISAELGLLYRGPVSGTNFDICVFVNHEIAWYDLKIKDGL